MYSASIGFTALRHFSRSSPSTQVTNGATSKLARLLPFPAFLKPASMLGENTENFSGDIQIGKKPSATSAAVFTPAGLIAAV